MTQSSTTTPLSGPSTAIATGAVALAAPALAARAPKSVGRRLPLRETLPLYALLAPTFLLLACFSLVPFVIAIVTSFFDYEVGGQAAFVGLANYREYVHDYTFAESFGNMIFLCTFSVIAVMIVPLVVAKLIFSLASERASYLYRILFLFPIVVPNVAVFLIWRSLIYNDDGLVNNVLGAIGLDHLERGWFSDPDTVIWAIACVGFPFAGGINILIYYAGLTSIPDSVHEAALLDGATGVRKFLLVDVPLVMSQIKLLVMLTIIGGIQAFEGVYVLTAGGIGFKSMVPGLWMYYNAFLFQRMGYACAIGVILFLLILTLTFLNLKYFRSSEQMQGEPA
jgi:raffinose/stachyose/melibiose transport system permease protein